MKDKKVSAPCVNQREKTLHGNLKKCTQTIKSHGVRADTQHLKTVSYSAVNTILKNQIYNETKSDMALLYRNWYPIERTPI